MNSIYPKITWKQFNNKLILKQQKPTLKLQTRNDLKCLNTLRTDSA